MDQFLFGGFPSLIRIGIVGTLSYVSLLALIRLTGQRSLGRMQTFDVVVAVALGSTYGRLLTAQEVQFSEALMAFALLAGLHYLASMLAFRYPWAARWMETRPQLLYYRGAVQKAVMRRHRLTHGELMAAVRKHGLPSLSQVLAIVLESDGSIAVVRHDPTCDRSALENVPGGD